MEARAYALAEPRASEGLVVEGLGHAYGERTVLRDVGLGLGPGEVHCLVGPSGCGKTTALRVLADLETALSGEATLPEGRRKSVVFQEQSALP